MSEAIATVRRPAGADTPAFDLTYVRSGPRTSTPAVVIPGGPGLASVLPYRALRRWAAQGGLDLIMVEHRGIGRSRTDLVGRDLPAGAMRVTEVLDDLAAVLDQEGVDRAFLVGSSYGSYLASSFGVRHPERVAGMLLDSALQSSADLALERHEVRALFWDAGNDISADVRALAAAGVDERRLLDVVRAAHELGGPDLVRPVLSRRVRGGSRAAWRAIELYATRDESIVRVPGVYEFDLAGVIGFRELGYGVAPDGLPLDPALTYAPLASRFPAFESEPYDLPALTPVFPWPMVLLSGDRDLRTPAAIAERVAATSRDAVLVRLHNGHSALDTHPAALLNAVRRLVTGRQSRLPAEEDALDRLPRRGLSARLPAMFSGLSRVEGGVARLARRG